MRKKKIKRLSNYEKKLKAKEHLENSRNSIPKINKRLSEVYIRCVELECYNLERRKK